MQPTIHNLYCLLLTTNERTAMKSGVSVYSLIQGSVGRYQGRVCVLPQCRQHHGINHRVVQEHQQQVKSAKRRVKARRPLDNDDTYAPNGNNTDNHDPGSNSRSNHPGTPGKHGVRILWTGNHGRVSAEGGRTTATETGMVESWALLRILHGRLSTRELSVEQC